VDLAQVAAESPPPLPVARRRLGKRRYSRLASPERSERKSSWLVAAACMAVLLLVAGVGVWAFDVPSLIARGTDTPAKEEADLPDGKPAQPSSVDEMPRSDPPKVPPIAHPPSDQQTLETSPNASSGIGT